MIRMRGYIIFNLASQQPGRLKSFLSTPTNIKIDIIYQTKEKKVKFTKLMYIYALKNSKPVTTPLAIRVLSIRDRIFLPHDQFHPARSSETRLLDVQYTIRITRYTGGEGVEES